MSHGPNDLKIDATLLPVPKELYEAPGICPLPQTWHLTLKTNDRHVETAFLRWQSEMAANWGLQPAQPFAQAEACGAGALRKRGLAPWQAQPARSDDVALNL